MPRKPSPDADTPTPRSPATPQVLAVFPPPAGGAEAQETLHARVAQYLTLLTEEHWQTPRAAVALTPLAYLLGASGDAAGSALKDAQALRHRAGQDLFGDPDIACVELCTLLAPSAGIDALVKTDIGDGPLAEALERLDRLTGDAPPASTARKRPATSITPPASTAREDTAAPTTPASAPAQTLEWGLRAIADLRQNAVIAAHLTASTSDDDFADTAFPGCWDAPEAHLERHATDALRAAGSAFATAGGGATTLVSVPVHYELIASRARRSAFLAHARRYQPVLRQQATCSIIAGPERPSPELLASALHDLHTAFWRVDWQSDRLVIDAERFRYLPFHSITLNAPRSALATATGAAGVTPQELTRVRRELHSMKIRFGVCGVMRTADLRPLSEIGVDYATGDAVSARLAAPPAPQRIALQDLPLNPAAKPPPPAAPKTNAA